MFDPSHILALNNLFVYLRLHQKLVKIKDTAQYFHSKQLTFSFEDIFYLKFGQVECKSKKNIPK